MLSVLFPGQGAQFSGMGKDLYDTNPDAKALFHRANEVLGIDIAKIMFEGSAEELKQTKITQTAIYIHSFIHFSTLKNVKIEAVAGHSLGEFSALAAAGVMDFESGLKLVDLRARSMQKACDEAESGMAAVLGLDDETVINVCETTNGDVIAANFNCPGQVVISGDKTAIANISETLKSEGAKRVLPLQTSGAFHSKFMNSAKDVLKQAILKTDFSSAKYPVYQNINAQKTVDAETIRENLVNHIVSPVLWTKTIQNMANDGISQVMEVGPGKVLQGLVKKIDSNIEIVSPE